MNDIKKKYIDIFFSSLTEKEKSKIYFEQYMWHAYSYKKLLASEGWKAIEEFKKCNQDGVYVLFQDSDEVIEKDSLSLNELIDNMEIFGHADCYIVDKNFKWTFIYTHETYYDKEEVVDSNTKHNIYYIGPFFATSDQN